MVPTHSLVPALVQHLITVSVPVAFQAEAHLVDLVGLGHTVRNEGGQVRLTDGLAAGQVAVAEHDVGLALLHQLHISRAKEWGQLSEIKAA